MKKRFIFEVDETLLTSDSKAEEAYFRELFVEKAYPMLTAMPEYLSRYERIFSHYDFDDLSRFLTMKTNMNISPRIVRDWAYLLAESTDYKDEDLIPLLESLKRDGKSLAVLTNWFGVSQIPRLKNAGIYEYFDDIFTGDVIMKPNKIAYMTAIGHFAPEESIFIGPDLDTDYVGPKACGIDGVLIDKDSIHHETVQKVKKIGEIQKYK